MADTEGLNIVDSRIPEEITIGETKFKVSETPELLKFIQAVGKVEKSKLYDTIENLKSQMAVAEGKINTLTAQLNTEKLPAPQNQPTKIEAKSDGVTKESVKTALESINNKTELNIDNIAEVMTNMFNTTLENALPAMFEKYVKPIAEKTSLLERETISQYREKRLAELGDAVIPEMVIGNSKEEIESAIVASTQIRSRYRTQEPTQMPTNQPQNTQQQTQPIVVAPAPPPNLPLYATPEERELNIRGMTDDEFAKNRDNLQNKLKTMASGYPSIQGNQ